MLYGLTGDNSGRCSPWSFTKKNSVPTRVTHCKFIALQKFPSDHCFKRINIFANSPTIFGFLFFPPQKTNQHNLQQSSSHCGSIHRAEDGLKLHFGLALKQEKGACPVISRWFPRSIDIAVRAVQRRLAYQESFRDYSTIEKK